MKGQTLQEWAGASQIFALVFTDIVDSTSLATELKDIRWIPILMAHFARARSILDRYNHHEIKIIGDSFMVAFSSPSDALDFVLDLYEDTGHEKTKIRAGIHVGSAKIVADDMFGIMVNYTKRVESTDNSAFIRLSDFAMTEINNDGQHARLKFRPRMLEFKGFPQQQKVWTVWDTRWAINKKVRPPRPSGFES